MKKSAQKLKARHRKDDIEVIVRNIAGKKLSLEEAAAKYNITRNNLLTKLNRFKNYDSLELFTKAQEKELHDHIIKCSKTQYGMTNTTIRQMIYEYAIKLPNCQPPKIWHDKKMSDAPWYFRFRSRHPGFKKDLSNKLHQCICIMGCHMGPEGKQALKKLNPKALIARVYHYLLKEFEYMKNSNDMGLLVNILRRTAEATGVCEQTITSILEEEKRALEFNENIPMTSKTKEPEKKNNIMLDHNYSNGLVSSNVVTMDDDSSSGSSKDLQYSDFERLQQDATLIKSVEVEILDDDDEDDKPDIEEIPISENPLVLSIDPESNENKKRAGAQDKMQIDSIDTEDTKLPENFGDKKNTVKINLKDLEPSKKDKQLNADDIAMRIVTNDMNRHKTQLNGDETSMRLVKDKSSSRRFEEEETTILVKKHSNEGTVEKSKIKPLDNNKVSADPIDSSML